VEHYLHFFSMKHNRVITDFSVESMEAILRRRWPGGVIELKAALEAAVLRCDSDTIDLEHMAIEATRRDSPSADAGAQALQLWVKTAPDLREALWILQELVYLEALEREEGNKSAAARLVGVKRTTFIRRLKEHGRFDE
jgi:DNA-binding NtrC family response regulator